MHNAQDLRLPIYISNKIFLHDYILSTAKRLAKRLAVRCLNGVEWELGQSGMNSLKMLMCVVNLN